jgi:hypothetical protein
MWSVVGGAHQASYVVTGRQRPVPVAANGYIQSVTERDDGRVEVRVATTAAPIGSDGTYEAIARQRIPLVPESFELPPRLRSVLTPDMSAWEAATTVLEYSADRLVVDVNDTNDQDAVSVLSRGRGRCSGVANATAALLMAAGFEARTVSGLLITDDGPIPHRWVACRLPSAGWVHTDPTLGLWTVTPHHVAFADAVVETPEIRIVDPAADGLDRLPRRDGRPVRPNDGSELVCRVVGASSDVETIATLHGRDGDVHRVALDPEGRFTALLPGRWRLVVTADGDVVEDRELRLRSGQLHSFVVVVPENRSKREVES